VRDERDSNRNSPAFDASATVMNDAPNRDAAVVDGFGDEWTRFDQSELSESELRAMFDAYFAIVPWDSLPPDAVAFDLGCGSGRWARLVAPRVGTLHCIDASAEALAVARRNLRDATNVVFHHAAVDAIPLAEGSADFGYSLGVLHHVPDTLAGLRSCVSRLRPGAPFLLYLYYAFDHRPAWFRAVWRTTEVFRHLISRSPHPVRYFASQVIAVVVYWPLARMARLLEKLGFAVESIPLSAYRSRSFYVMRTDALDRFGTRLERRFSRQEIEAMMREAGLKEIRFSEQSPYWCAVGMKEQTR
jgi:SAM-dependent methyltransferase